MNTLKDYVNWKLTHADKTAEAEGYPLTMENCKANKRMKQLEVYGNSVQDGTPTPENPIEVQSVGEKSVNLFGGYSETIIGYYTSDGAFDNTSITAKGIKTSRYISLKPNTTYTISGKSKNNQVGYIRVAEFDSDKNFIKRTFNNVVIKNPKLTFTTDSKTNFIAVCYDDGIVFGNDYGDVPSYIIDIQLEEGTTATLYEPYGKCKIPVVQRGINYHDYKKFNYKEQTINGITFTPLEDGSFHLKGKLEDTTQMASYRIVIWNAIPVKAGTYHSKRHSNANIAVMFGAYKKDSKFWLNIISSSNNGNATLSEDGYIGYCQIYVRANTTREIDDIVYPQLTKGTDDLPYEPYIEPVTTNVFLNEPLRKIGDYADYIDFKNNKVVRNTFVRVYDGKTDTNNPFAKGDNEENWNNSGDVNENFWVFGFNDTLPVIPKYGHADFKHPPICSQLPIICRAIYADAEMAKINEECFWFLQNVRNVRLFLSKDRFDGTRAGFLNYLKNNPITVALATYQPFEEPLNIDLPKLNAKTTIIEVDTSLAPSNAKGKYIKK